MGSKDQKAEIHDYGYDGHAIDEYGEPLYGYYWRLMNEAEQPITGLMGPYGSFIECHAALERAYEKHDY
jgi:hypothetical protein